MMASRKTKLFRQLLVEKSKPVSPEKWELYKPFLEQFLQEDSSSNLKELERKISEVIDSNPRNLSKDNCPSVFSVWTYDERLFLIGSYHETLLKSYQSVDDLREIDSENMELLINNIRLIFSDSIEEVIDRMELLLFKNQYLKLCSPLLDLIAQGIKEGGHLSNFLSLAIDSENSTLFRFFEDYIPDNQRSEKRFDFSDLSISSLHPKTAQVLFEGLFKSRNPYILGHIASAFNSDQETFYQYLRQQKRSAIIKAVRYQKLNYLKIIFSEHFSHPLGRREFWLRFEHLGKEVQEFIDLICFRPEILRFYLDMFRPILNGGIFFLTEPGVFDFDFFRKNTHSFVEAVHHSCNYFLIEKKDPKVEESRQVCLSFMTELV